MPTGKRLAGFALTTLGVILIIFGVVWMTAIFPSMIKLPADHQKEINFEGTYKVMNPETRSLDEIPVKVKREQQATEVQGNVLIINQAISTTHALAGMELPQFGKFEVLGVERAKREYVPGYGDMDRSGQFSFPGGVEKKSYSLWIPSAGRPLEAKFTGEEDFQGIKVFTFKFSEKELDIGKQAGSGLPQVLTFTGEMKVEPLSGTTVRSESINIISVEPAPGMTVPVYISALTFTDDQIADLIDTAKSARSKLLWFGSYMPWIFIGIGITLVISGAMLIARKAT